MSVDLLPWDDTGLDLLRACNTHEQTKYLGGPETEAKLLDRHARYLTYHRLGDTEMMRIAVNGEVVGSVGYWEIERSGEKAYEMGWAVVPTHQGQSLGASGTGAMIARLKPVATHRFVFALPAPDNPGSNGICRRLGFELVGVEQAEYPKGVWSPHNAWKLDLLKS